MAKSKTMLLNEAIQEVVAKVDDSHFSELLKLICQQAIEVENVDHLGAEPYERTSDRKGYRSGYKPRTLTAAIGDLNLLVPRDRSRRSPHNCSSDIPKVTRRLCWRLWKCTRRCIDPQSRDHH